MLGLFRAEIEGSTVAGVLGAGVVQNIFFAAVGASIYVILFVSRPGAFDVHLSLLHQHWLASLLIVVAGAFLVVLVARVLWHRFRRTWENAKEGAAILATPRRYLTRVVAVEIASYLARMGVNATFMYAYGVPVSARNVLLVIAANSISSTLAVTPGGVGTQQALASVALRRVAPAGVVTAYSLGQQLITTAWNVVFGLAMLATTIGWSQTRELIAQQRAEAKRKKAEKKAARRHSGDAPAAEPPSQDPAAEG
jgi:uncharacterized membrane protein YbhN (UPF0104 family)